MSYIKPDAVISPKAFWQLKEVLLDYGPSNGAYALGFWEGQPRIGFRWNGDDRNPIGNPQSRGLPTWTMLGPELHEAIVRLLPSDSHERVRRFLEGSLRFEGASLSDDRSSVLLWDLRQTPVIVGKVTCATIRELIQRPNLSDDDCRLVVDVNIKIFTDVAQAMFAQLKYSIRDNGVRIIEMDHADLLSAIHRLSLSALDVAARARWI